MYIVGSEYFCEVVSRNIMCRDIFCIIYWYRYYEDLHNIIFVCVVLCNRTVFMFIFVCVVLCNRTIFMFIFYGVEIV